MIGRLISRVALVVIVLSYLITWTAPFIAPYTYKEQFRSVYNSPPTPIRFQDREGAWHWRPFVYPWVRVRVGDQVFYQLSQQAVPVKFFVQGAEYSWMGREWSTHLFGLADPEHQIFLAGSDDLGRDLFSRLVYGARFSLTVGLMAIVLTILLGVPIGALAGYVGRTTDSLLMRTADLFLALPGLFLVLGIRAVFPSELSSTELYWLMVVIFSLIAWASVARVIRGQVLSLKTREFVLAAQAAGASHLRVLTRHILPFTLNYLVVQVTIMMPAFILSEVTLSFLGVGVQSPNASWGTMLVAASSVHNVANRPWLFTPALCIFVMVLAFNLLGNQFRAGDDLEPIL